MEMSSESLFIQYDTASATTDPSHYFLDNYYANEWENPNSQLLYGVQLMDQHDSNKEQAPPHNMAEIPSFLNQTEIPSITQDLLHDSSSSMMLYSDSQMETRDSSLTYIYDHGGFAAYFGDHQDLEAIAGFQAFSANSGSEVDYSRSIEKVQPACTEFVSHSIEFSANELVFSHCCGGTTGILSLSVAKSSEKTIVPVDSDSTNGKGTSIYKGVSRHRWTGRYEVHLWDKSFRREGKTKKGQQVYLGGYEKEEKAARAYDLAALKYWGPTATTNFPISNYAKELEEMKHVTNQEFVASLRRKSSAFSRGASKYRGVVIRKGKWQAKIGRVAGNKHIYLGTFATEEEAAEAYDIAAIKLRGAKALTNLEINRYDVEAIMKSSLSLPVGGAPKRLKQQKAPPSSSIQQQYCGNVSSSNINFSAIHQPIASMVPSGIPFDSSTNAGTAESSTIATGLTPLPETAPEFFIWPPHHYY